MISRGKRLYSFPLFCRVSAGADFHYHMETTWLWRTETYSYDSSDRLIQVDRDNRTFQTMEYDVNGNILSKTDVGTYNYDTAKRHAVTSIDVTAGKYSPGEQSVTYNFFGKVETIGEWNGDKYHELNITYGPDMERWKSVLTTNHEEKRTVIYSDSYECVTENGQTREFYYLGENVLLVRQTGKSDMVCHAITDNQGSILCIVDDDGKRLFEAAYDAWGKQEKITNTIGFLRGYTGHEMLPEFGLINMNGRVYDPTLGRFLSPDNYVQMPDNTQSFNRYSYCINNPLKYVDPSGELFGIDDIFIAFAAFNIASSMMQAAFNGENIWKAGGLSLLSSAASYGVGAAFKEVGTFGHELLRAGAHGLSSGVVGALSGDNFFSSAASGMGASLMGSYAQVSKLSPSELIAGTTVMGGALEWATGGNFFSGAMRGLAIGAMNFAEHDIIEYHRDKAGNVYGKVSAVEVTGHRNSFSRSLLGIAGAVNSLGHIAGQDIRRGSNGKLYFRHQNGRIFNGNQYVTTRALKTIPYAKNVGLGLSALSEVPDVMYACNKYGIHSREYQRALAVASGRLMGATTGEYYGSMLVGGLSAGAAEYFTLGIGVAPAYFCGEVVGAIGGGLFGAEAGGMIAGYMFDLGF